MDVPTGVLLPALHDWLQAGLGWANSHLNQFAADGTGVLPIMRSASSARSSSRT
jgi:hypothetical protein